MKKLIRNTSISCALIIFAQCEPTWIQDPIDPRLPKYTETANGVAGALLNGEPWQAKLSCSYDFWYGITCTNILRFQENLDGSLTVLLDGQWNNRNVTFEFHISNLPFSTTAERLAVSGKKIQIDGVVNTVTLSGINSPCSLNLSGIGQIYFKQIEEKETPDYIYYSGTFGFTLSDPLGCGSYDVLYGRFDYGLNHR